MFRLTIFVVVTGLQFLCFTRARAWTAIRFPGNRLVLSVITGLFASFSAALFVGVFFGRMGSAFPSWLVSALARPFYIWLGGTIGLGLVLLVWLVVSSPVRLAGALLRWIPLTAGVYRNVRGHRAAVKFNAARRAFLLRGAEGIAAASFGGSAYGIFQGREGFQRTDTAIELNNLPAGLDGFTIALVSDIHSSSFMTKDQMDVYCRGVMSLGADLIVVPGDFVNSQTDEVYPFAESFGALRAPSGVFGVMGNHDFYAGDPERVAREVNACGIRLLRNDGVVLARGGARFTLAGIDDVGQKERAAAHMRSALGGGPEGIPRILLSHRPYFLGEAADAGVDLVLSGHTHGGQIVLGHFGDITLTPAALASPYIWGKYTRGRTQMYVSRGIGTVGLPMRVNCPPEITKITLRRAGTTAS